MANQIPLSGASNAAGGYLLPPEQGEILVNGILIETGAIAIAGDARSTSSRKTNFPIWLGRPTAGPVSEGAAKPVTGAAFGQTTIDIKKFASIVMFTDEQIEDLQNGDLNVLVDAGIRQALSVATDQHAVGLVGGSQLTGGSVFNTPLSATTNAGVTVNTANRDGLQTAISAAMGILELNGYGNPDDIGVLLGFGFQQLLRDARDTVGRPLYDGGTYAGQAIDALYGLTRAHSTALASATSDNSVTVGTTNTSTTFTISALGPNGTADLYVGQPISGAGIPANTTIATLTPSGGPYTGGTLSAAATATASGVTATVKQPVGYVVSRPNIHVRVRQDVTVGVSNEASIVDASAVRWDLFQMNLHAVRYEVRLGYMIHDVNNAVVPLYR